MVVIDVMMVFIGVDLGILMLMLFRVKFGVWLFMLFIRIFIFKILK